jgi:hypothetical protein
MEPIKRLGEIGAVIDGRVRAIGHGEKRPAGDWN